MQYSTPTLKISYRFLLHIYRGTHWGNTQSVLQTSSPEKFVTLLHTIDVALLSTSGLDTLTIATKSPDIQPIQSTISLIQGPLLNPLRSSPWPRLSLHEQWGFPQQRYKSFDSEYRAYLMPKGNSISRKTRNQSISNAQLGPFKQRISDFENSANTFSEQGQRFSPFQPEP